MTKIVHFDPMQGCWQCGWIDGPYGTHLGEKCELHQKIEDLQLDLQMTDQIMKAHSALLGRVVLALGGGEEDDPLELAKARMEELLAYEGEAADLAKT